MGKYHDVEWIHAFEHELSLPASLSFLLPAVLTPDVALYLPVNLACYYCGRTIGNQIYIKGVSIKAIVELRELYSDVTSYCQ